MVAKIVLEILAMICESLEQISSIPEDDSFEKWDYDDAVLLLQLQTDP